MAFNSESACISESPVWFFRLTIGDPKLYPFCDPSGDDTPIPLNDIIISIRKYGNPPMRFSDFFVILEESVKYITDKGLTQPEYSSPYNDEIDEKAKYIRIVKMVKAKDTYNWKFKVYAESDKFEEILKRHGCGEFEGKASFDQIPAAVRKELEDCAAKIDGSASSGRESVHNVDEIIDILESLKVWKDDCPDSESGDYDAPMRGITRFSNEILKSDIFENAASSQKLKEYFSKELWLFDRLFEYWDGRGVFDYVPLKEYVGLFSSVFSYDKDFHDRLMSLLKS